MARSAPPNSQTAPLPTNLPFRLISRTIGQGAYAFIRKAAPPHAPTPVIAVKFINKAHAFSTGRLKPSQLAKEIALHRHLGKHVNIIQLLSAGEDPAWTWIAMELADGGDLFDKIEADAGVGEDIAHFYFVQLVAAVGYMHSKGVAHRDIKPENILLSGEGDLKIADFGLAALFQKDGKKRLCATVCGSPPYIAPEIVAGKFGRKGMNNGGMLPKDEGGNAGYEANIADIWSVGVVLFVLLVGNTPWDEPTRNSYEFNEFVETRGHTTDELWRKLPPEILSLLRGMLKVNPGGRFSLDDVRRHPWFTRLNPFLDPSGRSANPLGLATQMLENLRIDFTADPVAASQRQIDATQYPAPAATQQPRPSHTHDTMDHDHRPHLLSSTQPETPVADLPFDWERPPRLAAYDGISASQPTTASTSAGGHRRQLSASLVDALCEDVSLSQFTPHPTVPLSLTQAAQRFKDILPSYSLARLVSPLPLPHLLETLGAALHALNIPVPLASVAPANGDAMAHQDAQQAYIRIKTVDGRKQGLNGTIVVERIGEAGLLEVRFVKAKGDPLEWRRFFKNVVALCGREAVFVPGESQ
ncbi:CAMK/CAMKL/CHK1 protein kinase [Coniosporium apollinis CBS 100218]|uniref:CAMK/CAMKL/CHK1 protein kinase n=1 Tax=Coniosporium apollinis (strain CBS 100218) TaxID=1168221 RepID=R7Z413_CONA1|nr:CAMK/CAMKL/CHK1 protein kinase [Coniosporium apollinis CBS 100218]EON68843.1 CAMK/CAMKL/CHK1 protein kinase [Coniosporium apollinis CBS 100218]